VALGSDFDGGFGLDAIPQGINSIADLENIASALQKRGYKQDDIAAVMYANWLRVLRNSLPD
jgi:membrane dipeptidase